MNSPSFIRRTHAPDPDVREHAQDELHKRVGVLDKVVGFVGISAISVGFVAVSLPIGATILRATGHEGYDAGPAAWAGMIGGSVVGGTLALAGSACALGFAFYLELVRKGKQWTLVPLGIEAVPAGLLGSGILAWSNHDHLDAKHTALAAAIGSSILCAGGVGAALVGRCCRC